VVGGRLIAPILHEFIAKALLTFEKDPSTKATFILGAWIFHYFLHPLPSSP